jgi:hypothetical protein
MHCEHRQLLVPGTYNIIIIIIITGSREKLRKHRKEMLQTIANVIVLL